MLLPPMMRADGCADFLALGGESQSGRGACGVFAYERDGPACTNASVVIIIYWACHLEIRSRLFAVATDGAVALQLFTCRKLH